MKRFLLIGSLALCAATLGPSAWAGCPAPQREVVVVPPGTLEIDLPDLRPAEPGGWATLLEPPLHGEWITAPGGFAYKPGTSFWTLGSDRAFLRLGSQTRGTEVVAVHFLARTARAADFALGFEGTVEPTAWKFSGAGEVTAAAALDGSQGFEVAAGSLGGEGRIALLPAGQHPGQPSQGSGGNGGWRPPGSGGGTGVVGPLQCAGPCVGFTEATILSLEGTGAQPPVAWVRMRRDAAGLGLRLMTADTASSEPWLPISAETHILRLLATTTETWAAAQLWLDGELLDQTRSGSIQPQAVLEREYVFGLSDVVGDPVTSHFDELTVFSQVTPSLLCADSFESPTLSPQWGVVGPSALTVETVGLSGDRALAVWLNLAGSPAGGLLTRGGLAQLDIRRLGLRLAFDPTLLEVPPGSSVLLTAGSNNFGTRAFRVLIDGLAGGALQLRVLARPDNINATQAIAAMPLSRGPHTLELDWSRSETDGVGTGTVRLWLDGGEKAELLGVHNPNQTITEVGFGALASIGTASGKLVLDDIDFWYE